MNKILKKVPVLIFRETVIFPGNNYLINIARDFSIKAVQEGAKNNSTLVAVTQIRSNIDAPTSDDIFNVGTLCHIFKIDEKNEIFQIEIEGKERVKVKNFSFDKKNNFFVADIEILKDEHGDEKEESILIQKIINDLQKLQINSDYLGIKRNLVAKALTFNKADDLVNFLSNNLPMFIKKRIELLETNNISDRLLKIYKIISEIKEMIKIEDEVENSVKSSLEKNQRDFFIREKIKSLQKMVGDFDDEEENILEKVNSQPFPEEIKTKIKKEYKRLKSTPPMSLESSLIKQYINLLLELPWWQKTNDNNDLKNVFNVLNSTHYGLNDVKNRIVEYLAFKKKTNETKNNEIPTSVLCLFGPPGIGKTSIVKSIAKALNRKFFKISLAGMSDEAELRGHRRTYVASMPGRIISALNKCKSRNPVILLDEIDKISKIPSFSRGDSTAALLEILDPEQNKYFYDNFLEESFDLSDVLFITTANKIDNLPRPLLDRLELIDIHSYIEKEKIAIAKNFLIPRQLASCNLKDKIFFSDSIIEYIIRYHTSESGVRGLERVINKIIRKIIVEHELSKKKFNKKKIDTNNIKKYLGEKETYFSEKQKKDQIGIATGLGYTESGGELTIIEVNIFPGKGKLILTGKLGKVMRESAITAFDYVKSNAINYSIKPEMFSCNDVHIHFPEGGISKDGPSAGIAIALAIISQFSKVSIKKDFALTGEIDLQGNALPIGGLREKTNAAVRAQIKNILVPEKNKREVEELPDELKKNVNVFYMKTIKDAADVILNKKIND